VVQSQIDSNPNVEDVRRFKAQTAEQLGGTPESIKKIVDEFNFSEILDYYTKSNTPNSQIDLFSNILINPSWVDEAKEQAIAYMTVIYDTSRKEYYNKVKTAETLLSPPIDLDRKKTIEKPKRLELMVAIAEALVFRAESYVSPSTVMHVVRVIQAKEEPPKQKCNSLTIPKSKAQCALGKYGYIMSCLEQIGYLYRFHKTYCEGSHFDESKCKKKKTKYLPRLLDGLNRISFLKALESSVVPDAPTPTPVPSTTTTGGKRNRQYSKKLFKRTKTHRLKRTSRQNKRRNVKYSRRLK
jgi:hypothetical protein